jgi:hypothetical protein
VPDYNALAATAQRLIGKFGRGVTFVKMQPGTYNPSTNAISSASSIPYTVKGVRLDYEQDDIDGEVIKLNDLRIFLEAKGLGNIVPDTDDRVQFGTEQWTVVRAKPIIPADIPVYYELQLRK